jgi:hypothetical protein
MGVYHAIRQLVSQNINNFELLSGWPLLALSMLLYGQKRTG